MWGPNPCDCTCSSSVLVGTVHPTLPFKAKVWDGTVNTPLNPTLAELPTFDVISTPTPALVIVELAVIFWIFLYVPTLELTDASICLDPISGTWNWSSKSVTSVFL